jgi:hypothetical protein
VLHVTRTSQFAPGSNLKGDIRGANWALLMNRLELGRVLFLGAPAPATLSMIATLAEDVMVWEPNPSRRRQLQSWSREGDRSRVMIAERPQAAWRLNEVRLDLLCPSPGGRRWPTSMLRDSIRAGEQVYLETLMPFTRNGWARKLEQILGHIRAPLRLWLTPLHREIRSAVPVDDRDTARYFMDHGMCGENVQLPGLKTVVRILGRKGFHRPLARRIGLLHRAAQHDDRSGDATSGDRSTLRRDVQPPLYLRELALRNGIQFDQCRWGLWARGDYRSQKALFFLFDGSSGEARYVVKLVRDPEFNSRLENEYRQQLGPGHHAHIPRAVFMGHPGGLAAVGETAMDGPPFRSRSNGSASCSVVLEALEWLTQLGEATARPTEPSAAAEALHDLYKRFCQVYTPAPDLRVFLERQIQQLATSEHAIPTVFQHGDPGVWNVVVRPNGRVVFMDWEAAETHGMPLWDVLYFLRSYTMLTRVRGLRTRAETFATHFLDEGPLSGLIHDAIAEYCARTGVHPSLVEPLFYTCWMHRALKESNRLDADQLERGRFLELLQLCMKRHDAPGLQRLFGDEQRDAA